MAQLEGRPAGGEELAALALTNYGHFTTFRVEEGRVRGLPWHLDRLGRDCRALFDVELDADRIRSLVRQALPPEGPATVRVTVFDPATELSRPDTARSPQVLVTRRRSAEAPSSPLRVRTARYVREAPEVKSVGLFGTLWQRRLARQAGFDDALFVDDTGHVLEGGTWNVGFYDGKQVVWPLGRSLAGVTMRLLQSVQPFRAAPVPRDDLPSMQAAFATNAATGVRAIERIDDCRFPADHPVVERLREQYAALPAVAI